MSETNFTEMLQDKLQDVATDIPEQSNLWPRIHQRATAQQCPHPTIIQYQHKRFDLFERRKWRFAPFILVAALFLGATFAYAYGNPQFLQWMGDSTLKTVSQHHTTAVNRQVTSQGITLRVVEAYADGARTSLIYQLSGLSAPLISFGGALTDSNGHTYMLQESSGRPLDKSGPDTTLLEFLPLQDQNGSQTLTFTVEQVFIAAPSHDKPIKGLWQVQFPIIPLPGHRQNLNNPAIVHNSITVQPLSFCVAPSGAVLSIQIHGLTPDQIVYIATYHKVGGTQPDGLLGGGESNGNGTKLQLTLPDGSILEPVFVGQQGSSKFGNRAGADGILTLQIIFAQDLRHMHGTFIITIPDIRTMPDGGGNRQHDGPWMFAIPIN